MKEFIEDAISGGYVHMIGEQSFPIFYDELYTKAWHIHIDGQFVAIDERTILMEAEAWQAVEKVRGWNTCWDCPASHNCDCDIAKQRYMDYMEAMYYGHSAEEYLETIK